MTESSGHCELRLFVPPRLHKRIARIVIRSSARNIEVYDRLGEYLLTARGERSEASHSSRHYTAVFHVHPECFEVTLKFVSLSEEANLRLHLVHVTLVPYVWTGDLPSLGTSHSGGLNFERVHELLSTSPESMPPSARHLLALLEQQQATANSSAGGHSRMGGCAGASFPAALLSQFLASQHLSAAGGVPSSVTAPLAGRALSQDGKRDSSDSTSSGDQMTAAGGSESGLLVTRWLDARLQAMESRIMARLDEICARVTALEAGEARKAATTSTTPPPGPAEVDGEGGLKP